MVRWLVLALVLSVNDVQSQNASASSAIRAGPQSWRSTRDLAILTRFKPILWGTVDERSVLLNFYSAVPVFGPDGNYIALLHQFNDGQLWNYSHRNFLSLYCSGPNRSHLSEVRVIGNETKAGYRLALVFMCDWPANEAHFETFEVFLEDGNGEHLGTVVAKQKPGLLGQYQTLACVRDVWPSKALGLRMLPQWIEFNLLHGVDHFIIYTVNVHAEFLPDLYEPYIQSGVATRVHIDRKIKGEKQDQFHRDLHSWQVNDCLYRAKNHATWVLPSLDVDEYFHMKDGSIFGILAGGMVPRDYLRSSWEAIALSKGFQADEVCSIEFRFYRFKLAPIGQVEVSSVLREERLQPTLGKYVLNAKLSYAAHIHFLSAYKNGSRIIRLSPKVGLGHHYREPHQYTKKNDVQANVTDTSMLRYASELSSALEQRFRQKTEKLLTDLANNSFEQSVENDTAAVHLQLSLQDYLGDLGHEKVFQTALTPAVLAVLLMWRRPWKGWCKCLALPTMTCQRTETQRESADRVTWTLRCTWTQSR